MRRRIQRNIWIAAAIIGLLATVLVGAVRIHTLKREKKPFRHVWKMKYSRGSQRRSSACTWLPTAIRRRTRT
ncbi:hypothetical protein LC724_26105 [Blautia sp. RD014234]|nr:hypothetical protein [Blautia parvula]